MVKAGLLYFKLVFGAGFALGTVRALWVIPRVGARRAELMEMPIMLAVTIAAAHSRSETISLRETQCQGRSIT